MTRVAARLIGAGVCAAALAGCATRGAPAGPPSLTEPAGLPAPPQAGLYAGCVGQAIAAGTYDRAASMNVLRFRCEGAPARAFYEGLGPWSAAIGSEYRVDGRTWRTGSRLERDLVGVDYCSKGDTDDWRCTVVLNVGEFLNAPP